MSFVYEASYIDLVCDNDDKVIDSHQQIPQKIELETNKIECLENRTCALRQIQISNCQTRTKRNAEHKTAGFEIEITCDSHVCKYRYNFYEHFSTVTLLTRYWCSALKLRTLYICETVSVS